MYGPVKFTAVNEVVVNWCMVLVFVVYLEKHRILLILLEIQLSGYRIYCISGQPNLQCFPSGGHYHGGGRKILVVLFFVLVMMVMVVVGVEMGIALGGGWPS